MDRLRPGGKDPLFSSRSWADEVLVVAMSHRESRINDDVGPQSRAERQYRIF